MHCRYTTLHLVNMKYKIACVPLSVCHTLLATNDTVQTVLCYARPRRGRSLQVTRHQRAVSTGHTPVIRSRRLLAAAQSEGKGLMINDDMRVTNTSNHRTLNEAVKHVTLTE